MRVGDTIKTQLINGFLINIKNCIANGNFTLLNRRKNINFMHEVLGIQLEDVKNIIYDLSIKNYIKGPEEDRDDYAGMVWFFKYTLDGIVIYIKLRYDPPDDVVCISFHQDE